MSGWIGMETAHSDSLPAGHERDCSSGGQLGHDSAREEAAEFDAAAVGMARDDTVEWVRDDHAAVATAASAPAPAATASATTNAAAPVISILELAALIGAAEADECVWRMR